jgi:hypothetical protein
MAEMVACPSCQRKLQVPEQYLGQKVQCPECRHMFTATATTMTAEPPAKPEVKDAPKPRRYDDLDVELPRRRRGYRDDFDDDLDDDDYGGFHVGRRGRYPPHRGGMVLALGLVALVGGMSFFGLPFLLGPVAWTLGAWDLREMREGRMDPEGRGLTQAGVVCGAVATALLVLGLAGVGFCFFAGMH